MLVAHSRARRLPVPSFCKASGGVHVCQRGTSEYAAAKAQVLGFVRHRRPLLRTVPPAYVRRIFLEEEDEIDYILCLPGSRHLDGFALLSDKLLTSWVPPEWRWEYVKEERGGRKGKKKNIPKYTHLPTGRVVYDDLDAVWQGRHETDADIFKVRCLQVQMLCAAKGRGHALVQGIERLGRRLGITTLAMGAANEDLQRHYHDAYGFVDTRVGCAPPSAASRALLAEWHRAHAESDGLYGHLVTKCLR